MRSKWLDIETIYGEDGAYRTPYMTRVRLGRLRLHIFHRGDNDPDHHDHPWGFWTFPLTSYIEEVLIKPSPLGVVRPKATTKLQVVERFRWHYRPAEYTHRVVCRGGGEDAIGAHWFTPGRIVTIVWQEKCDTFRKWGFHRIEYDGSVCWIPWRKYVYEGGKHAPCEEIEQ